MVEINWTIVTYVVVGLFAFAGFSRGWWREAVTTVALVILVILLQNPMIAQGVIDFFNSALEILWNFIPDAMRSSISSIIEGVLGIETTNRGLQANAGGSDNWLLILLVSLFIAFLVSRLFLPGGYRRQGYTYSVTPMGAILGALLGGLNGLLIVQLTQEYLFGRSLPGSPSSEIAFANSSGSVARATSGLTVTATEVPSLSLFDGPIPWILIIFGVILIFAILNNRVGLHSNKGFRKLNYKDPYGYRLVKYKIEQ